MKRLLILCVVFLMSFQNIVSQDLLYTKSFNYPYYKTINANVIEISDNKIKYKVYNEPIRNVNISEVYKIEYSNGREEVFEKMGDPDQIKENVAYLNKGARLYVVPNTTDVNYFSQKMPKTRVISPIEAMTGKDLDYRPKPRTITAISPAAAILGTGSANNFNNLIAFEIAGIENVKVQNQGENDPKKNIWARLIELGEPIPCVIDNGIVTFNPRDKFIKKFGNPNFWKLVPNSLYLGPSSPSTNTSITPMDKLQDNVIKMAKNQFNINPKDPKWANTDNWKAIYPKEWMCNNVGIYETSFQFDASKSPEGIDNEFAGLALKASGNFEMTAYDHQTFKKVTAGKKWRTLQMINKNNPGVSIKSAGMPDGLVLIYRGSKDYIEYIFRGRHLFLELH